MWKIISVFAISLMIPFLVVAANDSLEIQLIIKNKIELSPSSITNIAVMLINNSETPKEFFIKITAPNGWSQISDNSSTEVYEESKKVKVLSFYVSESARVGDYKIEIEAFNKSDNTKIGTVKVPIYIKPRYGILLKPLKIPKYIFAGDTLSVRYILQNLSNVEVTIQATIVNVNVIEYKSFTLAPDSLIVTRIFATAVEGITNNVRNSVSLTAKIEENPETNKSSSCIFNVLPLDQVKFDAYNRIPINISGLLVSDNQFGDRIYGAMFNINGRGIISEKNKRLLEFKFMGPNRQGSPVLGTTDEYFVKYSSVRSRLVVGDNIYMLSNLTEGSRSGRGIEYEQKFKKSRVGSFVNYPRFYPDIQRILSVYGSYFPNKKIKINTGYLNKQFVENGSAHLMTISGESNPYSWANIKMEYALGKADNRMAKAYSTSVSLNRYKSRMFFNYTIADKEFPGYLRNTRYISTGISTAIFKNINLSANYNFNYFNIALDTMYSNAPFSENLNFSVAYAINYNNSIILGIYKSSREDIATPKQFDYEETTARLTYQSKIKRFGVKIYGAYGKTDNFMSHKEGELISMLNANASLDYKINKYIFIKGSVSYLGSQQYLINDFTNLFYGGTINANYKNLALAFQYQNNYEIAEYYHDRSLLALNTDYSIKKRHKLGFNVNYNIRKSELNKKQLLASFTYTYVLYAPISKRDDIGSLQGKIVNHGVESIEGVLINMDGNIAITDKNGAFEFPIVKSGTHYLFIDNSNSGLNSIAERPGPYSINIIPGQKVVFEVGLTKSGRIAGKLVLKADENTGNSSYIAVRDELFSLIIEASNGEEVYRVFTNKKGEFYFDDLRPAKWNIKVYDRGIPKGYKIVSDEFILTITSEQVKNIEVIIRKTSRKIKFQNKP